MRRVWQIPKHPLLSQLGPTGHPDGFVGMSGKLACCRPVLPLRVQLSVGSRLAVTRAPVQLPLHPKGCHFCVPSLTSCSVWLHVGSSPARMQLHFGFHSVALLTQIGLQVERGGGGGESSPHLSSPGRAKHAHPCHSCVAHCFRCQRPLCRSG